MAASRFARLLALLERRRIVLFAVVGTMLAISGLGLIRLRFDNTLDLMLPAGSPAQRMMAFLRDANFSNKIVISLETRDAAVPRQALIGAADALAASLGPPLVTRVVTGFRAPDLLGDAALFVRLAPQILSSNDLAGIEARLTPDGIGGTLNERYLQLLKPEGVFVARTIRADPLDINGMVMNRLALLATNMGYEVNVEDGHFVSRDGRRALLMAETAIPLTDAAGSRRLLAYLAGRIRGLPDGISASLVCGHTHVVSNEDTIKHDLGLVLSIASGAFVLLYLAFFRDIRSLLIFLMPALAALVALALTALWYPRLSYFVIAFGPVIAGIADDYGIAAYVAVRYGRNRGEAIRHIAQPVVVGALTTTAIFFAFFFSRIPAYRQLALFCVTSVFLAVAFALFLLPFCLRAGSSHAPSAAEGDAPQARHRGAGRLIAFAAFLLFAAAAASRVRFDSDITRLDGTAPAILRDEAAFQAAWGTGERKEAILATVSPTYEGALERNDDLYRQVSTLADPGTIVSLAAIWPSARTRALHAAQWEAFWRDGRETRLRRLLDEKGANIGFATNAFEPFFEHLYDGVVVTDEPVSNRVLASFKERFVQYTAGRFQALSYFPDDPALVQTLSAAVGGRDDVFLVSRSALGRVLSEAFTGEIRRTSILAAILILLTAWGFLRDFRLTLIALVPALTGVTGLLGAMACLGRPLNVANLISGIVVFGLCIDFGVHILHAWRHHESRASRMAVTFAALTTLMGAGALLFARHPALYSIGLTLVIGVGLGYVAAIWIVPALCGLLPGEPGIRHRPQDTN